MKNMEEIRIEKYRTMILKKYNHVFETIRNNTHAKTNQLTRAQGGSTERARGMEKREGE